MSVVKAVPAQTPRLNEVFDNLLYTLRNFIRENRITHDEYRRAVAFLTEAGAQGEVSLLCDVFIEVTADEVDNNGRSGTITTIEGPFYVPNAPLLKSSCALGHRPDEPGPVLFFPGECNRRRVTRFQVRFWISGNQIPTADTRTSIFLKHRRLTIYEAA